MQGSATLAQCCTAPDVRPWVFDASTQTDPEVMKELVNADAQTECLRAEVANGSRKGHGGSEATKQGAHSTGVGFDGNYFGGSGQQEQQKGQGGSEACTGQGATRPTEDEDYRARRDILMRKLYEDDDDGDCTSEDDAQPSVHARLAVWRFRGRSARAAAAYSQ